MSKKEYEQWHPPFVASYRIDFREFENILRINPGYLLEKSSQIDILVVKKDRNAEVRNGIGGCYREHNIIEYKSPDDLIDASALLQATGYACLYMRMEHLKLDDVMVSLVGYHYPKTIIEKLKRVGYTIRLIEDGVYLLQHEELIDIQIVLVPKIDPVQYPWITMIRKQLSNERIADVIRQVERLQDSRYEELAETVTDLILRRLKKNNQMEGVLKMNETRNLFKAEFEERDAKITELTNELQANKEELQANKQELQANKQELQTKDSLIEKLKAEVVRLGGNVAAL